MSERRPRFRRSGTVLGWIAAAFLSAAPAAAGPPPDPERGGECLVLIDLDAFYCGLCLEALLAFCRAIPAALQESRVRGILIHRPPSAGLSGAEILRIARKKWDGLRRAHGIRFPVLADEARIFQRPEKAGASVVLLDVPGGAVRTFLLPLKPAEVAEVLRFLRQ